MVTPLETRGSRGIGQRRAVRSHPSSFLAALVTLVELHRATGLLTGRRWGRASQPRAASR